MTRERAIDPNTPPNELIALAPLFMAEALENPALPLLLLENPSLSLFFHYLRCVHQNETNGWAKLSTSERQGWMRLSYERAFNLERFSAANWSFVDRAVDETFTLDGEFIDNADAFFCAVGEAINGPGGYFGQNIAALNDCCSGGFGRDGSSKIVWLHSKRSIAALRNEDAEYFEMLCAVFQENDITIEER
jgi:RNAse (barnase) inhibitor barstar